jgi:Uma2 family endonuclease
MSITITNQVICMVISALKLNLNTVNFTDEQFYQLCQKNGDLKLERTSTGELIIMPPVGGFSLNLDCY